MKQKYTFIAEIITAGSKDGGRITIPIQVMTVAGLRRGDYMKSMFH